MNLAQAEAWEKVFDLCKSLGMDPASAETGEQAVLNFINKLAAQQKRAANELTDEQFRKFIREYISDIMARAKNSRQ